MNGRLILGIALVIIGFLGILVLLPVYRTVDHRSSFLPIMGPGMMGYRSGPQYSEDSAITMDQAKYLADQYIGSLNDPDLSVKEIMEFERNFYAIFCEESSGIGAFEMLIWKYGQSSGQVVPEPGPNMMWNTKYGGMMGHMGGGMMGSGMMGGQYRGFPTADMPIDEDEAKRIGQEYLDEHFPDATVEESTKFYGYYTFDFGKEGKMIGMFSVNGYNGQVWYHGWHGVFIGMEEYGEHHD